MGCLAGFLESIRNDKNNSVFLFLIGLLPLAGCVSQATHDALTEQYMSLEKKNNALVNDNQLLNNRIVELETQKKDLGSKLETTSEKLSRTNQELSSRSEELQSQLKELELKEELLKDADLKLKTTHEQLNATNMALQERTQQLQATSSYVDKTNKLYDELVNDLKGELKANQIKIQEMKDGVTVNLSNEILFSSGSAELNKVGEEVITRVSPRFKDIPHQIVVAGFTDNIPIRGTLLEKYPSNWELAAARAASVVKLLEKSGIDSYKLIAVSFGENQPVASNDTEDGRRQNRRIEIRLRPVE